MVPDQPRGEPEAYGEVGGEEWRQLQAYADADGAVSHEEHG